MTPFLLILPIMRTDSDKFCGGNQNTHFCSITNPPENNALYEIMWKNIAERGRPQMTIWRMRIACWIPKATTTHSEYALFIACPLQQRLHERSSILRHTYFGCHSADTVDITTVHEIASLTQSVASPTDRRSSDVPLNGRTAYVIQSDSQNPLQSHYTLRHTSKCPKFTPPSK